MAAERYGLSLSRRTFVRSAGFAGLVLLAGCGRLPRAEQPVTIRRLGVLAFENRAASERATLPVHQELRELGYGDHNLAVEYRAAEWQPERLPGLAAELVSQGVEVLLTMGEVVARAAMQATTTTPIVFRTSGDPVPRLVPSYAHPGGNATGVTMVSSQLAGKRLDLLKQLMPATSRVAVLWQPSHADTDFPGTQSAAQALGIELLSLELRDPGDIESAFEIASGWRPDALIVVANRLTLAYPGRIMALAAQQRLAVVAQRREYAEAGSVLTYGPSEADSYRRLAYYLDRIFKGTQPADLPVEQPTRFELVVNLKAARELGLAIPQHVLLQATEIIQ
ncbi:MAG TPA: ABC transporter substrate-binding protein [Chloroflexota bacterium]|nr:ABC transporter substrate-binding protein [Chloroflexota bacterium]